VGMRIGRKKGAPRPWAPRSKQSRDQRKHRDMPTPRPRSLAQPVRSRALRAASGVWDKAVEKRQSQVHLAPRSPIVACNNLSHNASRRKAWREALAFRQTRQLFGSTDHDQLKWKAAADGGKGHRKPFSENLYRALASDWMGVWSTVSLVVS
jgi:hypothetical protein